jgi:hypothetical protein
MNAIARWFYRQSMPVRVVAIAAVLISPWVLGGLLLNGATHPATNQVALVGTQPSPTATEPAEVASPARTPEPEPGSKVTAKQEVVTTPIPYGSSTVDDPNSPAGSTTVVTAGVAGTLTQTYRVTYTDGIETARTLLTEIVTTPPVAEVVALGSFVPQAAAPPVESGGCDPNYTGPCVPVDSDVDCAGGSGNGPSYVSGPVFVVGSDVYDLDRDGDGVGCD